MDILSLADEWKRQLGDSFRLGDFHDRLLSYGMPPVKVLRMAMLGDEASRASDAQTSNEEAKPVEFSLLATGTNSTYEGGRVVQLITDGEGWRSAWEIIG